MPGQPVPVQGGGDAQFGTLQPTSAEQAAKHVQQRHERVSSYNNWECDEFLPTVSDDESVLYCESCSLLLVRL